MAIQIKKSHKFLAIVFLVIYFLYLVVSNMPARYLAGLVQAVAPNVYLNNISGSVWNGVSHKAQININRQAVSLGSVKWKVKLLPLLTLKACVDVDITEINQRFSGEACRSLAGNLSLSDFSFDVPVAAANSALPAQAQGQLSGEIMKMTVGFTNNQPQFSDTQVKFSWSGARVYVDNIWYSFGTFAADITDAQDGAISAKVFDISGPYGVDLQTQWQAGGAFKLEGTILPKSNANKQVVDTLTAVFEQNEQGAYNVKWPL